MTLDMDDLKERIESRVAVDEDGCWMWTGTVGTRNHGLLKYKGKYISAHKTAYRVFVGEIPEGMNVSKVCKERLCVNPDHMRLVDMYESQMEGESPSARNKRKTHCCLGHEFTEENTIVRYSKKGRRGRSCRECRRSYKRRKMQGDPMDGRAYIKEEESDDS